MLTKTYLPGVDRQQILLDIGYSPDCQPSARSTSLIDQYADNIHSLVEPSYSYVTRDIDWVKGHQVHLKDSVTFESGVVARLLEICEKVAIFAMTIGSFLEDTTAQLSEQGLILEATVLDAMGSDAAEQLADFVQDEIADIARAQGRTISRRFSPGYCDWDVTQQRMVFEAMAHQRTGIRLTDGCLMIPRKSISGIIGIGSSEVGQYNPCVACLKQDCPGRRS